jgi:hypothetical protein
MNPQNKTHRIRLATDAERLARMLKALGNPVRFQIVQTLAERQTCITQEIVIASIPTAFAGSRSRSKPGCPGVASRSQTWHCTWSLRARWDDASSD